jgi:hypothetical protein
VFDDVRVAVVVNVDADDFIVRLLALELTLAGGVRILFLLDELLEGLGRA